MVRYQWKQLCSGNLTEVSRHRHCLHAASPSRHPFKPLALWEDEQWVLLRAGAPVTSQLPADSKQGAEVGGISEGSRWALGRPALAFGPELSAEALAERREIYTLGKAAKSILPDSTLNVCSCASFLQLCRLELL